MIEIIIFDEVTLFWSFININIYIINKGHDLAYQFDKSFLFSMTYL